MSEITLTINGIEVTVPAGTNVVDAARQHNIDIPVFCYHPRLKTVGMCRMCLVAIGMPRIDRATGQPVLDETGKPAIAMLPKLQTACTTLVSQGMVVQTNTEEVLRVQRGIVEFLLTSHPLDCPICDKGGECPLQNLAMGWGPTASSFDYHHKMHHHKPVPLGNLILLDRERCILCSRCVRFQDDVAGDEVLGFYLRGRNWHIISKSTPTFDSKFSGNTTDICPVGALTTVDFRFKARVWELQPVPSVCTLCSVGCNITLDMRLGAIQRVMPRENSAVNDIWLCDKGRFGQTFVASNQRLTTPLIRRGTELVPATWDEALSTIAERVVAIHRSAGGDAFGAVAGNALANEDYFVLQRFMRELLGSHNLDHRVGSIADLEDDTIGVELGVPTTTNLMHVGNGTMVLVIGADPEEEAPLYVLRLRGIVQRGGTLITINNRPTKLDAVAAQRYTPKPGSEAQFIRGILSAMIDRNVQNRLPARTTGYPELRAAVSSVRAAAQATGITEDTIRGFAEQLLSAKQCIIVYGTDALAKGQAYVRDIGSLLVLSGLIGKPNTGMIALTAGGNSRGALDMGISPNRLPGYAPVTKTMALENNRTKEVTHSGLSSREMWGAASEKRIRSMFIVGSDPVASHPHMAHALKELDLLVVQDMFLTATAHHAHVVLPTAAFAERDGTYTNAERRVQRARQAYPPPGTAKPDWMIIQLVARAIQTAFGIGDNGDTLPPPDTKKRSRKGGKLSQEATSHWRYAAPSDVALDIAEHVPGYQGITYAALSATGTAAKTGWGRQTRKNIFYDGTSYTNTEGVGIQYPAPSENTKAAFTVKPENSAGGAARGDSAYPLLLLPLPLLYDANPLLQHSLLAQQVPEPYVMVNPADAQRAAIQGGQTVQITSSSGSLSATAQLSHSVPVGCVLVPQWLPGAPLTLVQTGAITWVNIK